MHGKSYSPTRIDGFSKYLSNPYRAHALCMVRSPCTWARISWKYHSLQITLKYSIPTQNYLLSGPFHHEKSPFSLLFIPHWTRDHLSILVSFDQIFPTYIFPHLVCFPMPLASLFLCLLIPFLAQKVHWTSKFGSATTQKTTPNLGK